MEFRETLARRHSSRAYEATPVSDEALDTILAAGRAAPVGMGEYGTVHLTVVTGSEKMAELRKFFMASESHDPLYGAPAFIVVSAKPGTVGTLDAGAIIEICFLPQRISGSEPASLQAAFSERKTPRNSARSFRSLRDLK